MTTLSAVRPLVLALLILLAAGCSSAPAATSAPSAEPGGTAARESGPAQAAIARFPVRHRQRDDLGGGFWLTSDVRVTGRLLTVDRLWKVIPGTTVVLLIGRFDVVADRVDGLETSTQSEVLQALDPDSDRPVELSWLGGGEAPDVALTLRPRTPLAWGQVRASADIEVLVEVDAVAQ